MGTKWSWTPAQRRRHSARMLEVNAAKAKSGEGWRKVPTILDQAKAIIYGDREKTYGEPGKNLRLIAGYWTEHLNSRFGEEGLPTVSLTPDDVCIMMVALKLARLANDPTHRDSQVDAGGYLALMERIQTKRMTSE